MIAKVSNENFGYSVTCDGYWAAVGNPNSFRYNPASSSFKKTGSVEIYKYNINTDVHDIKTILYRPLTQPERVLLSTEIPMIPSEAYLHTEYTGSIPVTADMDLLVNVGQYYSSSEDGYGWSLDMKDTLLAVGNPYFSSTFTFESGSIYYSTSGSDASTRMAGYVDLFDVSTLDIDPYAVRSQPMITGTSSLSGYVNYSIYVPPNQNYTYILLQSLDLTVLGSTWQGVAIVATSNSGGNTNLQTNYTTAEIVNYQIRLVGIVGTNPYLTTIFNPNSASISESFGRSVSLNDEWLAVGSPEESGSKGAVFMFRKLYQNSLSWSYIQTLPTPSNIVVGDNFGSSIAMNKMSSSYSWSMVVGSEKPSTSNAYVYEFNGSSWVNTFILGPDNLTVYPLPFYPTIPIVEGYPNYADHFGYSVGMYKDTVMVGAPTDRTVKEYSGSANYEQGAVYFFDRCANRDHGYYMARKSYGNEKIMKDNLLGWSVDVHDQYAISGIPKTNALWSSICYLRGSLFQDHYCNDNPENQLNGQFILFNKTTGSIPDTTNVDWDITNIYQIKKRFLSPYRVYGWDASICSQFITIGSPMLISGSNVIMDLNRMTGSFTGSVDILGDLSGKAYIYNLKNLRPNIYVGNVFYRNGKIVVMTSGSAFEGLQLSNVVGSEYQYEIDFKSKQTIFEKQVVCPVEIGEFNVSTNPSAVVFPNAEFDINNNGQFDFQDADVLLRYMAYKSTEATGYPNTDWSSSIVDTKTDEEVSVYDMYYSQYTGTDGLFTSSYSMINNTMYNDLDFNEDNKINSFDMNILWKYFIYRLTQKNYESWITPSSKKKFLSDILDYLNEKTMRGQAPQINQNFLEYAALTRQDPTGSYLAPTVTSVGLYSGCDLVAVAKLGSPIKITPDFPINFVVKMDF